MTGYLWAVLGLVAGLGMTAPGDMASEEIRDRLDHLPHAILRLAARCLDPSQRTAIYHDEWLPELTYILKGAEARPITRLITGTTYAVGILISASRIAHRLHRPPPEKAHVVEDGYLALDGHSYQVLHFAGHGKSTPASALTTFIDSPLVSKVDIDSLSASELRLVVLNACDSARTHGPYHSA